MNKDDLIRYKREVEEQKYVYKVGKDNRIARETIDYKKFKKSELKYNCDDSFDTDLRWWNEALVDKSKIKGIPFDMVDFKYYIGLYYDAEELEKVGVENYKQIRPIKNLLYVELMDDDCYNNGQKIDLKRYKVVEHPTLFSLMTFDLFKHKMKKYGLEVPEIKNFDSFVDYLYKTDFELVPARLDYTKYMKKEEVKQEIIEEQPKEKTIEDEVIQSEIDEILEKVSENDKSKTLIKKLFRK